MKITANLIKPPLHLTMPLTLTLWALCIFLIVYAAGLIVNAIEIRETLPRYEARLKQLNEKITSIPRPATMPPAAELEAMRQRVNTLNTLSGVRGWSTPKLLAWFESRLPNNVYFVSFHHKPLEGEILLVAESSSAEALTAFLLKLEKEPDFSEVLLSKQGTRNTPGSTALQFEVRIRQKS